MGFGSFFRGIGAQLNPFDAGKTYGSYNPPQKKKQEQTNAPTVIKPTPKPNIRTNASSSLDVIKGAAKKPTDFGTLQVSNRVKIPNNEVIASSKPDTPQKPQVKDTRAWGTKLFDTLNPNDDGRSWAVPGKQSKPNFVQRNLSPTGVFNIGKETVQGSARLPVEMAMTAVAPVKRIQAADKLRSEGAKSGDPRFKEAMDNAGSHSWQPSGWQKRVFGSDKVQNFAETGKDIKGAIKDATGKDVNSAIPTAAIIALNMIPGGRKASKAALKSFENASMASKSLARDIPVQEAVDRGIKIPTRVVEGAPIQDVTPRLPGETPALAPKPKPTVRTPEPSPLIQDVAGGETFATPDSLVKRNAEDAMKAKADRFNSTDTGNMNDVTPRTKTQEKFTDAETKAAQDKIIDDYAAMLKNMGEGNGVAINQATGTRISNNFRFPGTGSKRLTKAQWRDQAEAQLRNGNGEPSLQKAFDDAPNQIGDKQSLLAQGEQVDVPVGTPIKVKQVKGIDVQQVTDVPANLPETPGTVRVSSQTDPLGAQTQAVANAPVASSPEPILPPETQAILDNPRQFNKRQVAAARNQRKLARQLAKTQADTQAVIDNAPALAPKPQGNPGIIGSGEFKKGRAGIYETANVADQRAAAVTETSTMSGSDIINRAQANVQATGRMTAQDVRDIENALFENPRYKPGDPEYIAMSKLYGDEGTAWGQEGAFRNAKVARRTGTGETISNQAISKLYALADDPTRITADHIANIQRTSDAFATARDTVKRLADEFNGNPSKENYDKYLRASNDLKTSQKEMAMAQFTAGKEALRKNTNIKLKRLVEDSAKDADIYTMDYVDASMLSNTGTFVRNFTNATFGSIEEGLIGGIGSRVASAITGAPLGGGIGRGSFSGFKSGVKDVIGAAKTRAGVYGHNPLRHPIEFMKNWSTTGNQLGDSMINGSVNQNVVDHYTQMLKQAGYTGDELKMRANVMAREDPQNLAESLYAPKARQSAGLGSGITKTKGIERFVQRKIADGIADVVGKDYTQGGENIAKLITRVTIGFPSAVGRSLAEGVQRVVPLLNTDTVRIFTAGNPQARAMAIKQSIKKSGSAAVISGIFMGLGANGTISGAYPSDPNERAKWERDGIKENSIKIGDAWYDLPSYAGSFGVPMMIAASIGRNGGINENTLADIRSIAGSINPTEQMANINDAFGSDKSFGKYTQKVVSSAGRALTPFGSLMNQLSKVFDTTENDTSGDTWLEGTLNKLIDGVPILDHQLPDKTDAEGNPLYNPSVVQTMLGAAGAVQGGGEQRSQEIIDEVNSQLETIDKYGLLSDPNLDGILKDSGLAAFNKAKKGKQLDESDIKALKEGLVKGVSKDGTDTAYLEKGQYDTNLAVLNLKRELMADDPSTKPSDLKDLDTAIKRGTVYKDNQVPYELISEYKSIGVDEWRNMGNPEKDEYDPDMYQKLYEIDQMLTEAGVSYKEGALDKPKYFAKTSGSGSGSGSGKKMGTDFGTLSLGGVNAPNVRQYDMSRMSGTSNIPIINIKRPEIVHKITQGSVQ
jgi:hypothetical protein